MSYIIYCCVLGSYPIDLHSFPVEELFTYLCACSCSFGYSSQASLNNNPCYPHNQVQQWSYRPNSASKTINNLNTNPTAAVGTFTDIEEEIHHLHSVVKQLEGDVKTKQSVFKDEMEVLSSKLQDAVCVPPMGRSVYC